MLHLEYQNVGQENAIHVYVMTTGPEVKIFPIFNHSVFSSIEADHEDHERLGTCVTNPNPELLHIKNGVCHANAVEEWSSHEDLFLELKVKESIPNVVQAGERDVINLVDPLFIHGLSREYRVVPKHKLHHYVQDILVEHEQDQLSISAISLSPVYKE